ncbi:NADPH2:quinone reductase [Rhizomicrobium palustre]|uniref:NADPH2:quinone reductase n=1 Tax=Rhizomicrobium palustre TaxID=189966 RepID=A0A846MVS1_9PROT|nr:NAD(P)H-quinone oxidoreductase [Rhizomicrobium palustre]NIK87261.1 NADPH2:quinone reductase [Rhizomicrobium palustre]
MRAIVYEEFGPAEVLHLAEVPVPQIRPSDLLVKVGAAGVNRADLLQRNGFYGAQQFGESPLLGLEVAGEVIAIGDAVTDIEVGARVMAIVGGGGYGAFARVDRAMAVPIPDSMSFHQAAAVMESFVTAVEAVSHLAGVKAGQSVLIHSAAGGIGSAAVQLAHSLGAVVYATASAARHEDVLGLGADAVIDYRTSDFEAEIAALTNGAGVDAIVDFVGGDYLARNLRSLKPGGVLVQVGILSGENDAVIPLNLVLHNHLRLVGTVMKSRTPQEKRAMVQRFAERALPLFAAGKLRPLLDHAFPLAQAAEAHRRMEKGGGFGKIVLTL